MSHCGSSIERAHQPGTGCPSQRVDQVITKSLQLHPGATLITARSSECTSLKRGVLVSVVTESSRKSETHVTARAKLTRSSHTRFETGSSGSPSPSRRPSKLPAVVIMGEMDEGDDFLKAFDCRVQDWHSNQICIGNSKHPAGVRRATWSSPRVFQQKPHIIRIMQSSSVSMSVVLLAYTPCAGIFERKEY